MSEIRRSYLNQRLSGSYSGNIINFIKFSIVLIYIRYHFYLGLSTFLKNRKKFKDKEQVRKELMKLRGFAMHQKVFKKFPRRKILANFKSEIWQIDLKEVTRSLVWHNNNYKFILFVVDTFSGMLFTRLLKKKTGEAVTKAFESVLRESKDKPVFVFSDR